MIEKQQYANKNEEKKPHLVLWPLIQDKSGEKNQWELLKYCLNVIFEDAHLGFINTTKGNHFPQIIHRNIE